MGFASTQARMRAQVAQPKLETGEAVAVLYELKHRAERRLLDACQEFQDIAFEMEWRLRDWQALVDQRRWLQRDLNRAQSVRARFNVDARKRSGLKPRDKAWTRQQQSLRGKLMRMEEKIAAATAAIIQRNAEGAELEAEILSLQQRADRIDQNLRPLRRPRLVPAQKTTAAAEALARLIIELSNEPDVSDAAALVIAAHEINERLDD